MKKFIGKRILNTIFAILGLVFVIYALLHFFGLNDPAGVELGIEKPVIYLYPEKETEVFVDVSVDNGEIFVTYPEKNNGWNVVALPDGKIIDENGVMHNYLFWEAKSAFVPDFSEGFVVEGKNSVEFLQEKLSYLGMNQNEINEFIVYWLPYMIDNPYNLVSFQLENYDEFAPLTIEPKPDSVQRVYMALKPLDKPIEIPEQQLEKFERTGFAVIEWGGSLIK